MSVYDVESLTSLANQIAPYVSQVLASKHKKEVSSIDLVTDFTNLYSLPCYYWNRQTGVKRPVNVAISDVVSTVEAAANEELIKIKEMAKDSAESADRADQAAQQSAQSAAESAATALDQKNQTIDYLNTVKKDEATRVANENIRLANEQERKTNESERINKENIRRSNEDIRIQNENDRIKNENERKSQEITRQSNESLRLEQEQDRQDAETIRNSNENTRISNENTRKTQETNRQNKEAERQQSETDRINSENERNTNELTRIENENTRLSQEEGRVTAENNREEQFNISKEAADQAADRANDVASHQPYIGEDLYWYLYDESTKSYNKTTKYSKGDNFSVKATFSSITEMEAYVNPSVETASNPILKIGDFIVIATDVEQEDNAKLYVVSNVTSTKITFDYIADFSGARGFTGHTPQLSIGTITTGSAGTAASVSLTEDGIDANGNPKYKINFTIPRGDKGDTGEAAGFGTPTATIDANVGTPSVIVTASGANTAKVFNFDFKNLKGEKGDKGNPFTYDDFTEEQIAILQKPATDATAAANAAAQAANTAASNADQATADAINATANAETAANNANQAATNANDAASNANTAVGNLNWDNLKNKPSTFTPSAHNHTISEITDIGNASVNYASSAGNADTLDGNHASAFAAASHSHSYLPLSGGTISGYLSVTGSVTFLSEGKLKIWNVTSTRNPTLGQEMVFVQTSIDAADPETKWPDKNRNDLFLQPKGGHVHIGPIETAQDYTCYVAGTLRVAGTITYGSLAQGSDVRKKNIINNTMLLIDDIANAPLFTYTYKDNEQDKRIHSGTSAQYWEGVNSGLFTTIMQDGSYGLMSSELSLCAAISIAKQFRDYKEKTDKKIEDLQNQINELKELINTLK